MQAMILAGGLGTRISELTQTLPKPMIEIGGKPIIWHIMKTYAGHGITEFVICAGYKSEIIKKFFKDYRFFHSDMVIELKSGSLEVVQNRAEDWKITIVDSGVDANTGKRVLHALKYVDGDTFLLTYGDTLSDVNISGSIKFHESRGSDVTVTVRKEPDLSGRMDVDGESNVTWFVEKPTELRFTNRGFFVINRDCLSGFSENENSSFEMDILPVLVDRKKVGAFVHDGFVQSMDTLRERNLLQELWETGPPWKCW